MPDNTPAFPKPGFAAPEDGYCNPPEDGMTIRDYFAAKAMQGLLTRESFDDLDDVCRLPEQTMLANTSYQIANAMIVARKAKENKNA